MLNRFRVCPIAVILVFYNNIIIKNVSYIASSGHKGDLSKEILISNVIGSTSSVMIKKSVLEKVGYFDVDMPATQDYDLWIRVCQVCLVGYIEQPEVNYYNNIGEIQISSNVEKYEQSFLKREKNTVNYLRCYQKMKRKKVSVIPI